MFLFKLSFLVLGTATLGAVGTGIYYGIKQGKPGSELKDGNGNGDETNGQTEEKGRSSEVPEVSSTSEDPALEEAAASLSTTQFDQGPTVVGGLESLDSDK